MFEGIGRAFVRSLSATLLAYLLLPLLVVTTPTGTGDGAHASVLLHPLFSHSHVVGGRIVSHEQMANVTANSADGSMNGPAFGAGAGASAPASDALAISPTLPWQDLLLEAPAVRAFPTSALLAPPAVSFAPPDPPPTSRFATHA